MTDVPVPDALGRRESKSEEDRPERRKGGFLVAFVWLLCSGAFLVAFVYAMMDEPLNCHPGPSAHARVCGN